MKYLLSLIILIVLSFPAYANSTIFKCKVDGVTTYQNTPIQELRDENGEAKYNTLVKIAVHTNVIADEQKKEGYLVPHTRNPNPTHPTDYQNRLLYQIQEINSDRYDWMAAYTLKYSDIRRTRI